MFAACGFEGRLCSFLKIEKMSMLYQLIRSNNTFLFLTLVPVVFLFALKSVSRAISLIFEFLEAKIDKSHLLDSLRTVRKVFFF